MFPRGFPTPVAPEKHCAHSWAQSSKHAAAQTASVVTKSSKSQYCVVDSASIIYIYIYTMCYHIVRVWTTSQFMATLCSDLLVRLDFHPTAIVQLPRLFWDETTSVAGCQMTKRLITPKAKPYGSVKYLIVSHYEYILGISWEGPFPWCHFFLMSHNPFGTHWLCWNSCAAMVVRRGGWMGIKHGNGGSPIDSWFSHFNLHL